MRRETTLERFTRHVRENRAEYPPGVPYLIPDTPRNRRYADIIRRAVSGSNWWGWRGHIYIAVGEAYE